LTVLETVCPTADIVKTRRPQLRKRLLNLTAAWLQIHTVHLPLPAVYFDRL
jgi:hypothetical protein